MWNLIKNVLRSLSKNKVSVIGLTFLTFLAICLYTVLTSATGSIIKEYNYITKSGNLHDFTISENYSLGNAKWVVEDESWGWSNTTNGPSSGDKPDIYWPLQTENTADNFNRSYHITLYTTAESNTLVGQFYAHHGNYGDPYYYLLHPTCEVSSTSSLEYLTDTQGDKWSNKNKSTCDEQFHNSGDAQVLASFEQQCWQSIMNVISDTDTPIQNYLNNDSEMKDKVSWRNFRSIDINNSPDGIYYKIVQSSPDDTIDKMVTFNDSNSWSIDNNKNFSVSDFNPLLGDADDMYYENKDVYAHLYDDPLTGHKQTMIDVLNYSLLSNPVGDEWLKVEAYFHMLTKGNTEAIKDDGLYVDPITPEDDPGGLIGFLGFHNHNDSNYSNEYQNYLTKYANIAISSHHNYKFTINWSTEAPSAWWIEDWTSNTTIAAPKYMSKHHLSSLTDKSFVNEESYIHWCENHSDIHDERTRFIGWMNSLKEEDRDDWINRTANNYSNSTIRLGGEGSVPYLIMNQGITVDFVYPIVNITNSTPNPNKECIFFTNANGYARAFDSYRSNPVENYLVGKFANGVDEKATLDLINTECQTLMTWPKDIKAAYMANDTNDVLNASAFRIAYIPVMIDRIQSIALALIIFILVLSICICGIVIHRYISNARTQIGIMFANGIKKWQIGLSLLPFALIPAIFGGIIGYIVGFSLQGPTVGLFSNYWMLPVIGIHFSILTMMMMILIPFVVFIGVSFVSTLIILREKTVNLMKSGSEFKTNWVSRHIKQPFVSFNILTKFRISFAFNSLTRLVVLTLMVALSMTSLVFSIAMSDKFQNAQNLTTSSRNYTYAIDLFSPTSQAGQYIPVNADNYGESGFIETSEGKNWIPNIYYDEYFVKDGNLPNQSPLKKDESFKTIFGNDNGDNMSFNNFYGIPKVYYQSTYEFYNMFHPFDIGGISRSFSQEGMISGTTWYPMSADSIGENCDIMYAKNRSMIQNAMDYTVGIMGYAASNPWMIALSLMPENQKNLCDSRTTYLVQQLGEATHYNPNSDDGSDDRYKTFYDAYETKINDDEGWKSYFNVGIENSRKPTHDDPTTTLYTINKEKCLDILGVNLKPSFMQFLNIAYDKLRVVNRTYNSMLDNEYEILYNKVPLKFFENNSNENDETYTYLSTNNDNDTNARNFINGNNRILGIKDNSHFVKLVNDNGTDLSNLISTSKIANGVNPIIVNAFAAKKHNLSVGDHITFNITNRSNRYQQQINKLIDSRFSSDNSTTFTIVGINTTYEGEEYFTNQQLANKILGLRTKLDQNNYDLHNYYVNSWFAENLDSNNGDFLPGLPDKDTFDDLLRDPTNLEALGNYMVDLSSVATGSSIMPIRLPANPVLFDFDEAKEDCGNITPYGYNGVFTNKTNGSTILNGGVSLYAPTGLYPGNDNLESSVVKKLLQQGINLEMANIISGIYDPNKANEYSHDWIGWKIDNAFNQWVDNKVNNSSYDGTAFNEYVGLVDEFVNTLVSIFGKTVVTSLVSGALDRDSMRLVFTNLSNTITHIEELTIAIITFMVSIIVILIAVMLIGDSKRLAATLKALGYTDKQNIFSFLSIYAPVIAFGLAVAIPLSYAATHIFQDAIFNGAKILLTASIPWWSFLVSIGAIGVILGISIIIGHYSLKRDPLVNQLKE